MTTAAFPRLELTLPASPASARRARRAVAATVSELGADDSTVDDVRLCVSEAVTNAVLHAYGAEAGTVDVTVLVHDSGVVVVVRDFGSGVMSSRGDCEGGLGLAIIDAMTDQCALSSVSGIGTQISMAFGTTLADETGQRLSL